MNGPEQSKMQISINGDEVAMIVIRHLIKKGFVPPSASFNYEVWIRESPLFISKSRAEITAEMTHMDFVWEVDVEG